jgi:glycosyltransferase involved in cell wall biosynthesis
LLVSLAYYAFSKSRPHHKNKTNLSILIPLNEEESLKYSWIIKVMQAHNYSYEIIFLDDGSTDASWSIIEQFASENTNVKGVFHEKLCKSQALHAGFAKAQGDVIITMDADLQDSPEEIRAYII